MGADDPAITSQTGTAGARAGAGNVTAGGVTAGESTAGGATASDATDPDEVHLRRRAFLRKVTTDTVVAGGRLAASAAALRRSAAAATGTLIGQLEQLGVAPAEPKPDDRQPATLTAPATPTTPASPASPDLAGPSVPEQPPQPRANRSPEPWSPAPTGRQAALLEGAASVVLATIQPGRAPHLSTSPFHWDGSVFRLSALDWTVRTRNVEGDPHVSLLVADPGGLSVAIEGSASIVAGPSARDETRPILRKYAADEDDVDARWSELNAGGDRVVIVVTPVRMVWATGEPALRTREPMLPAGEPAPRTGEPPPRTAGPT